MINIIRPGVPNMGRPLTNWFLFSLIVSLLIAYVASHAIPAGARYLRYRHVGAVDFSPMPPLWFHRPSGWANPGRLPGRKCFDGLLYGLVTAGTFGLALAA